MIAKFFSICMKDCTFDKLTTHMSPVELIDLRKKRGEALRMARRLVKFSKVRLSQLSGLSRSTITNMEAGKSSWTIDTEMIYLAPINENIKN